MTVSFDNPSWWLLAAAVLPLLVHLVARSRPKERAFSSVVLLQELVHRQIRRARPKEWLLLLLRTLACAFLALAFMLPKLGGGAEGEGGRALIVVLDDTASMGASDGQLVRMNQAIGVARSAVEGLAATDRLNLVRLAGHPYFLFDSPQSARSLVLRELAKAQSQPAASDAVSEALAEACRQLRSLPEGVQGGILLVSDFQESTMKKPLEAMLAAGKGLNIRCVSVAQVPSVENTAVTGLTIAPRRPLPGQEVVATVRIRNESGMAAAGRPESVSVTLAAGDLRLSQACRLSQKGEGEVQFRLAAPATGGDWVLTARIGGDAFPGDDSRHLVVSVADKLDCLAIAADKVQLGFMAKALAHIPFLQLLCLPALPEEPADFIVWNAPTAADVPAIKSCMEEGATVMVLPDLAKDAACSPLLYGKPGVFDGEVRSDGGFWQLDGKMGEQEGCFALLSADALRSLGNSGIYARLGKGFGKGLPKGVSALLRYQDGVPALLRRPMGKGCLLVWNMPVDARNSRMGFSPFFLPMLAEVLKHSRGTHGDDSVSQGCLARALPAGVDPGSVRLLDDKGQEVPLAHSSVQAGKPSFLGTSSFVPPGIYRWMEGEKEWAVSAVNFPLEESELRSFAPPESRGGLTSQSAAEALRQGGDGVPRALWPWLLGAAFSCLMIELLICRLLQVRQSAQET